MATGQTLVLHRDAGTADHGVELVARHELGQRTPQRQDHATRTVLCMHAAAPQLHHIAAQMAQAHQVKFGFGIEAANAARLRRCQYAVGADHHAAVGIAHQQVLAIVIEQVDIVFRQVGLETRAHFQRKHLVAQTLGLAHLVQVTRPLDLVGLLAHGCLSAHRAGRQGWRRYCYRTDCSRSRHQQRLAQQGRQAALAWRQVQRGSRQIFHRDILSSIVQFQQFGCSI